MVAVSDWRATVDASDGRRKVRYIMENQKSGYTGNIERSIEIAKLPELAKVTADKPIKVGEHDGVTYYKTSVVIAVDERFPTKAGNMTTTVVIIPVDGAKQFETASGNVVKFDGVSPFIYQGRGVSHVFTVVDGAGDVVKRQTGRKSAQAEIDALNAKMDTIMAALAAMAKK